MKVIIDAMGGDFAPAVPVEAAVEAVNVDRIPVVLVGREDEIKAELAKYSFDESLITVVHASETIAMDEHPVNAVRRKKDSSLVVGMRLLKEDPENSAFVSCGSTGALLAGGLFVVGRIRGIDRPALAPILPNVNGGTLLIDCGANAECKVRNLEQFAQMGSLYMQRTRARKDPKVGLVNIGTEETKGTEMLQEVYSLLKRREDINFVGNIEAREIPEGNVDVVVCDGFVGNVILKLYEGVAMNLIRGIKSAIKSGSLKTKIGGLLVKGCLKDFMKDLNYEENGGAPLLGVDGIVLKSHGNSKKGALLSVIRQAKTMVEGEFLKQLREIGAQLK